MLKFHKYTDSNGEYRWNVRARNGRIIADGAEGYSSAQMRNAGLSNFLSQVKAEQFTIVEDAPVDVAGHPCG